MIIIKILVKNVYSKINSNLSNINVIPVILLRNDVEIRQIIYALLGKIKHIFLTAILVENVIM